VDGELILGGVDESIHTCGMVTSPVVGPHGSPFDEFGQNQFWTISVDAANMGENPLPLTANGTALIDSGFFAIGLAEKTFNQYSALIDEFFDFTTDLVALDPAKPLDGFVPLVPCANLSQIPALSFFIGGVEHKLSALQLALQDNDTMQAVLHRYDPPLPIDEGCDYPPCCMLAVAGPIATVGIDVILGQPFLHTVYTAFSMEDPPHIAIGKLECPDDKGDNFWGKIIGIVLGVVFLGILLWLFVRCGKLGKVMSILLGVVVLGMLFCCVFIERCGLDAFEGTCALPRRNLERTADQSGRIVVCDTMYS